MNRSHRFAWLSLALVAAVLVGCRHKLQPIQPTAPSSDAALAKERARLDSIKRAEQARQDSIARARAADSARSSGEEKPSGGQAPVPAVDMRKVLEQVIYFDYDKSDLTDSAITIMDAKLGVLRAHPEIRLRINGHTDDRGSDEYNLALGMRRAAMAKQYLTNHGVDGARFELQSFGAEQPADPRESEEAWAKNRRCEFEILEGKAQ